MRAKELLRRAVRRARRLLVAWRWVTVRAAGDGAVRVAGRTYRLDGAGPPPAVRSGTLRVVLPDPAALVWLAAAGALTGEARRLRIRLRQVPEWLLTRARPARPDRTATLVRWRRRSGGLTVTMGWSRPQPVPRALAGAVAMVMRVRSWEQTSGQLPAGPHTWLPPYLGRCQPPPLLTSLANPYGRVLAGAATRYRLVRQRDRLLLCGQDGRTVLRFDPRSSVESAVAVGWDKYAVIEVDAVAEAAPRFASAVRALAACGAVFATGDEQLRDRLGGLGLATVADPGEVDDLAGYALSVAASRRMAIAGDAALRRTALLRTVLGEGGVLPLPAVSVVLASKRPAHIEACLDYLAAQDYPALEVLVGLHGYDVPEPVRQRWRDALARPLRVAPMPGELPFGAMLGRLSRMADGDLITKVDDDDHYGAHHVTDLVLAWHTSGADLVAKGARFVHFPETDETIDRAWAAPEVFDVSPAGGTLLLGRGTLQQVGGWSHARKHVDEDLLARVREAGGVTYRTHALEYVYVRREAGHTFQADLSVLREQAARIYEKLPYKIIHPAPASLPDIA